MLVLYEHPLSPYAQKVKIALLEKGIPFTARLPRALGTGATTDDEFRRANPRLEVPLLIDGDLTLFDSTIILEYLEDRFPEPALLPQGAAARARARTIEEVMDSHYEPINWGLSEVRYFRRAEGELAATLERAAAEQTRRLQAWLESLLDSQEYLNGAAFGWADLCVVPYLNGSVGFGLGPVPGTALASWLERVNTRSSTSTVRHQAGAAAQAMTGVAEMVAKGQFKRQYRDHRLEWMVRSGGLAVVQSALERGNIRFTDFG